MSWKTLIHITLFTIWFSCASTALAQNNYTLYSNISYKTISGIDQNLLSLDIYKPTLHSGTRPVMIYIHGGYWRIGDKGNVASKANLFTDSGFVFVSINYRLSPEPSDTLLSTAVRFPIHPQDCADAIKWVFDNISNYSGDTSKVSLIGHSAGAHLVLLLSTNNSFLLNAGISPENIKCVCTLDCGMFDLIYELENAGNSSRRSQLINAFGTDTSLYDDASPLYHIQPDKYLPWVQLVHQGKPNQLRDNNNFKDSLLANNHTHVYAFNAYPYEHKTINVALGNPLDSIGMTDTVMHFFGNCLANNFSTEIEDLDNGIQNLFFYPNPTDNFLFVDCKKGYHIYSLTGQLVKRNNQTVTEIDISDLTKGLYIIKTDNRVGRFVKM